MKQFNDALKTIYGPKSYGTTPLDCQLLFTVKQFDYLNIRTSINLALIATLQQIFVLYVQNLPLAAFNEYFLNIFNAKKNISTLKTLI